MRKVLLIGVIFVFFPFFSTPALAESIYVLPYPSYMPGSMFYQVHRRWEAVSKYWYFGNFSQFTFNLKFSDKYLVEAKTLFEYKQYLYAHEALIKSDKYFTNSCTFLSKAKKEGVNTTEKEAMLNEAGNKHIEILQQIKQIVPEIFVWTPEKVAPTSLFLWEEIDNAIKARRSCM